MKWLLGILFVVVVGVLGAMGFAHSGVFNIAADEPHSSWVLWMVTDARERSIAIRAQGIKVPDLNDPDMLTSGGADYNEMCTECHLKPGHANSELRSGMYPQPPNLSKVTPRDPAQTFWIIKHGIKMSGMPAWGATHDDQRMWAMVAFLQKLPSLTPEQYQILTARDEEDGAMDHMQEHTDPQKAEQ